MPLHFFRREAGRLAVISRITGVGFGYASMLSFVNATNTANNEGG